ncbi:unnamed protein product [Blepharisma stoltei]|uniref:Uncharacterized protein n=1 Tax=Blepharisma stoltei TaxID=1481888 RepID=A0AAU9I3Z5_9CILI|nr:unnamed protein product [Blepharisma stoltei]
MKKMIRTVKLWGRKRILGKHVDYPQNIDLKTENEFLDNRGLVLTTESARLIEWDKKKKNESRHKSKQKRQKGKK